MLFKNYGIDNAYAPHVKLGYLLRKFEKQCQIATYYWWDDPINDASLSYKTAAASSPLMRLNLVTTSSFGSLWYEYARC